MSQEKIPSEEELAAAVELAKDLPRISKDDIKPEEIGGTGLFGNNFYMLFLAMRQVRKNPNGPLVATYLRRAEKLEQPWRDFLSQNVGLLAEMDAAMEELEIYNKIFGVYTDICIKTRDVAKVDDFDKKFDSELGINAVAIPIFRKLNILLPQAADAMRKLGMDPFTLKLLT